MHVHLQLSYEVIFRALDKLKRIMKRAFSATSVDAPYRLF